MTLEKLHQKIEKMREQFETFELDANDENASEFQTLKSDILVLLEESEELVGKSIEAASIEHDSSDDQE